MSTCPVSFTLPWGAQLHRAMTEATCLVTVSPTGLGVLGGSKGQPSHSFSRCSGEERAPPSAPQLYLLSSSRNIVISVPSPQERVWGQPQSCLWRLRTGHRKVPGKEIGLLVSLPELLRAQSVLTQDSKAIWANSWESHEQRITSGDSSACHHHPQRQSWGSAVHGKPCPQS